jgi:23S rRNA pseudouridine1911/1915/1917 synthase
MSSLTAVDRDVILYQDHHLLVVNKPAGLVIHPTYGHKDDTLWNRLLAYLARQDEEDWQPPVLPDEPGWERAPAEVRALLRARRDERVRRLEGLRPRPALLHRLDKDTSGVVVLARTENARKHLVRQFQEHTVVKRYLAVVQPGAPAWTRPLTPLSVYRLDEAPHEEMDGQAIASGPATAVVVGDQAGPPLAVGDTWLLGGPIQRDPQDRRRCLVGPQGREARTVIRVLCARPPFLLLEARPITGRIHQIRAHLTALGYGLVGDQTYGPVVEEGTPQAALGRQFLHAFSLTLRRYPDDLLCTFSAPLAPELQRWLERYFPEALVTLERGDSLHGR